MRCPSRSWRSGRQQGWPARFFGTWRFADRITPLPADCVGEASWSRVLRSAQPSNVSSASRSSFERLRFSAAYARGRENDGFGGVCMSAPEIAEGGIPVRYEVRL
jgi:hypothetical protein